jgi:PASTA domain
LEQAGLEVQTIKVPAVADDVVVSISPPANDRIPRGSLVILYAGG